MRAGYGLSSAMKLALVAATTWPMVLAIRVADRAGKGLRDAPRDVLIANSRRDRHGTAFGVQQAMDKTGGFLGPLVGLAAYELADGSFDAVFAVAFVPCAISVALLWRIPPAPDGATVTAEPDAGPRRSENLSTSQRTALMAVGLHALGFVSVPLLLLRALDVDASIAEILLAYSALRFVTAVVSYPIGRLVDSTSARAVTITGMMLSALAVAGVGVATTPLVIGIALATVGLADAMTRGPVKVWLIGLGPDDARGAVLGDREALTGIATLVSSIAVGLAWQDTGRLPLLVAAAVCAVAALVAARVTARPLR